MLRHRGNVWLCPDGRLMMNRCPRCLRENHAMSVSSGECAWCGERAHHRHVALRRGLVFRKGTEVRIVDHVFPESNAIQATMSYVVPTRDAVVFSATVNDFERWRADAELIATGATLAYNNGRPKWEYDAITR